MVSRIYSPTNASLIVHRKMLFQRGLWGPKVVGTGEDGAQFSYTEHLSWLREAVEDMGYSRPKQDID